MKEYSRGCHPNSLKALDRNRHKGQFTHKQSKVAAEKSAILRHVLTEAVQYGMSHEDEEAWEQIVIKAWDALKGAAMAGDLKALRILWRKLF